MCLYYINIMFGDEFKLTLVYVSRVSDDGTQIWVSELDRTARHVATMLSPIPTDILSGRRFTGVPRATGENQMGDLAVAAIIDKRYYILGFFNWPMDMSMESTSLSKNYENIMPQEGGTIHKISPLGQIIYRTSNWITVWLGKWASQSMKGIDPEDYEREPTLETRFSNIITEAWGGITKWLRVVTDDDRIIDYKTKYTAVYTKSREPRPITDVDLSPEARNDGIDDTQTSITGTAAPANPADLNYIDKVIHRKGTIDDTNYVNERETRSSIEHDKEKTAFTRLLEGYNEGTQRDYTAKDMLAFTTHREAIGSNVDQESRLFKHKYTQYGDDTFDETTPLGQFEESFGDDGTSLWSRTVTMEDGTVILDKVDSDNTIGRIITYGDGTVYEYTINPDSGVTFSCADNFTITISKDGEVQVDAAGSVALTGGADVTINTGTGGLKVNGHYLVTEDFLDWLSQNASALGLGNMAAPVPLFPAAQAALQVGTSTPDNMKTDKI